jgi:hypothetical protein
MVGSCTFTVKEKLALPVLFLASFAVTVYSSYTKIYSTKSAFAAINETDGSIKAWGISGSGGTAPSGNGYTKIYSTEYASCQFE